MPTVPDLPQNIVVTKNLPRAPDNIKGLVLMGLGFFVFAAVDTMAKFLTDGFHPIQIVWTRQLGLVFGVIVILLWRGTKILKTAKPKLQFLRGALAVGSATCFITGVSFVPLADAISVTFIAPLIVTVLGALILREKVGLHRWSAIFVGFLGTLIVIRPGLGIVHPAVFFIVLAASMFAVRQVLSRMIAPYDNTYTTVAYTALVGVAVISIPLPFFWAWPSDKNSLIIMFFMAAFAGLGELLVIRALEIAEAVVLAPVHYSMILWSVMYGYLVFAQLPDGWTLIGTTLIVATGLYTMHRERLAARSRRAAV
ncbi:DMT family transporter [Roseobacter sp. HKCCD7870]|uniref:DMT family transporter n=1 Tax=Roseobacter sp. HKCCD7870 TaxID=3120343 RepID=UPI0030EC832D